MNEIDGDQAIEDNLNIDIKNQHEDDGEEEEEDVDEDEDNISLDYDNIQQPLDNRGPGNETTEANISNSNVDEKSVLTSPVDANNTITVDNQGSYDDNYYYAMGIYQTERECALFEQACFKGK